DADDAALERMVQTNSVRQGIMTLFYFSFLRRSTFGSVIVLPMGSRPSKCQDQGSSGSVLRISAQRSARELRLTDGSRTCATYHSNCAGRRTRNTIMARRQDYKVTTRLVHGPEHSAKWDFTHHVTPPLSSSTTY